MAPGAEGAGTREDPLGTIEDALAQVEPGAIVGLLAGVHDGFDIARSDVIVAGVCREDVSIRDPGDTLHAIGILADDVTLAGVTVVGSGLVAVDVLGSARARVEDVTVRDFQGIGIYGWGGSDLTLASVVVENGRCGATACAGVLGGETSPVSAWDLVIRDVDEIGAQVGPAQLREVSIQGVRSSARAYAVGLKLRGSATVADLRVVDVDRLGVAAYDGAGVIDLRRVEVSGVRTLYNAVESAVYVDAGFDATLRDVTVQDSDVPALVTLGDVVASTLRAEDVSGLHPELAAVLAVRGSLHLSDATVERSGGGGVLAYAPLTLDASEVRDVIGFGVQVGSGATIDGSAISEVHRGGYGPGGIGYDGIGVVAHDGGELVVRRTTLAATDDYGVAIRGGSLELDDVRISDARGAAVAAEDTHLVVQGGSFGPTRPANERAWGGFGVYAVASAGRPSVRLAGTELRDSEVAGVYLAGVAAELSGVSIVDTAGDGLRGVDAVVDVRGGQISGAERAAVVLERATGSVLGTALEGNAMGVVQQRCDGVERLRTDSADARLCRGAPLPAVVVPAMAWSNAVELEEAQ